MKKHPLASYLLDVTGVSLILCFAVLFLMLVVPKEYLSFNIPYYIMMFFVVTLGSYAFLYYSPEKTKINFNQAFFLTRIVKFSIYVAVLVTVLLSHIEKNIKFAFAYTIIFVVFQIFDTIKLTKLAKEKK